MVRHHNSMQWREFLKDLTNKNNLVKFIVNELQLDHNRKKIQCKLLYATCMERCIKIRVDAVEEIEILTCTQEEVDT